MSEHHSRSPLDRQIPVPGWYGLIATVILIIAAAVRIFRLDAYLLNLREARWAYESFSFYTGRPMSIGRELPDSGPVMIVWNGLSYFLFGVTDASARVGSVVFGLGLIAIIFLLRPAVSRAQTLGIAGILAISPTMVFASRTIEPGIAAAFFAVLILVAMVRIGSARDGNLGWATVLGIAVAGLYATGPLGVSTLIALLFGLVVASLAEQARGSKADAIGAALRILGHNRLMTLAMLTGLLITMLVLFSRFFTDLGSLSGIGTTMVDWATVMTSGTATVPAFFSFWSLMLYETIAVVIALVTLVLSQTSRMQPRPNDREIAPLLYIIWFGVALLLHALSTTRDTDSAVLVALPILLLAGSGLGRFIEKSGKKLNFQMVTATLVTGILVVYSVNAMVGLAFTRGESGSEPLALNTPTAQTRSFLDQVMRLSRDISVNQMTPMDPTGRFGLTIQATPEYEWPFTWYFREFPDFRVTPPGAFTSDTDVAIAAHPDVMESVGLTPSNLVWINKPGEPLTYMRSGAILRTGLNPTNWGDAWNYMIHRDAERHDNPRMLTYGYSVRVMNKLHTEVGPFNLFDGSAPGPGGGLGQLDTPSGIAVGEDGTIYVLNAGNVRIDRFNDRGEFLGIWSGQVEEPLQLSWNGFQGGTGLHVGPDGLIYIADTWNHAVVVVNPNGTVVRVLGNRGIQTDITDEGDPADQPGLFFGPRDVAVTDERIYVTDTGNERVQVFAMDGTYIAAFGGYGENDGQFIEPTGISVAEDGTVWVADSGNSRLQVFDADGVWLESHRVEPWEDQVGIQRLNLMVFDENGVLYFTSPNQGVWAWYEGDLVQVRSPELELRIGELPGQQPLGIAIDGDGRLLITLTSSGTVVRIDPVALTAFNTPEATPQGTPQATPTD